jgi:hypothetical protein
VIVCTGVWVMLILGMAANLALMYSLGRANWLRLVVWLAIGQAITSLPRRRNLCH